MRHGSGGIFHRRLGSDMLDRDIIPLVPILVSEKDAVAALGVGIGLFKELSQFRRFAEGRFDEEDVIDVGPFRWRRRRLPIWPRV